MTTNAVEMRREETLSERFNKAMEEGQNLTERGYEVTVESSQNGNAPFVILTAKKSF